MKRHLIALDLDGTLLTNDHRITARTEKVLLTLIKQGHIVVIVTGRPFHSSIGCGGHGQSGEADIRRG